MWLETSLFKLKGCVKTRRLGRPTHTLLTSTKVPNTHHTQLKAWSTQSDLITEGQTATPLSSGVNQTQMFSAACSCLLILPLELHLDSHCREKDCTKHNARSKLDSLVCPTLSASQRLGYHVMFNLVSKSHTRKSLPRLTCWLLCSCYAMRGFSFQWGILLLTVIMCVF